MTQARILVVEDDNGLREALVDTLLLGGYECREVDSGERALLALSRQNFDMVISDIQMGGMDGLTLLATIRQQYPQLPVLLMTAYANIDGAVRAMREGAIDYLAKPFSPEVLLNQVSRYVPAQKVEKRAVVYGDPKTAELFQLATRVARSEATVMVTGPSGTGKEVLARYIHDNSSRAEQPFIAINCAAIPENMLEATLFGYEKGAFTGAVQGCPGKFEQAQGGTLLLDEITEMDLGLQAKLLRVLQEKEVERLGSRKMIPLDVRVIATSNRDLKKAVQDGLFREDLYYRLNVFPIELPPLRERREDIPLLVNFFIKKIAKRMRRTITAIPADAMKMLVSLPWYGNIRELENIIERAVVMTRGQVLNLSPDELLPLKGYHKIETLVYDEPDAPLFRQGPEDEREAIIAALKESNGIVAGARGAAQRLGMKRTTLLSKMKRLGISAKDPRIIE